MTELETQARSGKPLEGFLYVWDEEWIARLREVEERMNATMAALVDEREKVLEEWPRFTEETFEQLSRQS